MDMCWAWIINPIASKDFLKKCLLTIPVTKLLTFGGNYIPVESVLGQATIARKGIPLALNELVDEQWITLEDALGIIEPVMYANAYRIFNLSEKNKILKGLKWADI